jgi:hypothetical protein
LEFSPDLTDELLSQALRELEQELHTEIVPGTEIMIDVGTHHFVKAGTGGHSVLVPQPSDDQHDPLVSSQVLTAKPDTVLTESRTGVRCGKVLQ